MLRRHALVMIAIAGVPVPAVAQNSTAKRRPEPSAVAARAGSAVPWRESLDGALRDSAASEKPVFWYVPTVYRSPMDRQVELDRYMMAGPFSWPRVVAILERCFVPLRVAPDRAQQERFGLGPRTFIEPGFLVLASDGTELERLDEITTLHEAWFVRRLLDALPEAARSDAELAAASVDDTFRSRLYAATRPGDLTIPDDDGAPEPWQWKLAAEREGHGPYRYGFEIPFALPDAVLDGGIVRGTRAPAGAYDADALRACGVRFLAWMQQGDGSFTDSRYDFGGADSMPNVWTAVTALAGRAMLDVGPRLQDAHLRATAARVAARALDWCIDDDHLALDDRDELAWALLYRIRFGCHWVDRRKDRSSDALLMALKSFARLMGMQSDSGAWFHEYSNPFVTASVLVALAELDGRHHDATITLNREHIDRGIEALRRCVTDDGAVSYSDTRRGVARAAVAGSVGRMPVVFHALRRHGAASDDALADAIRRSFDFHDEMAAVRKYDDHASRLGYGGFFFWYGMHGRAEAIAALPDGAQKEEFKARLRAQVLALPEIDGCFVDSHELGRVYGTAMALLCLGLTEPD